MYVCRGSCCKGSRAVGYARRVHEPWRNISPFSQFTIKSTRPGALTRRNGFHGSKPRRLLLLLPHRPRVDQRTHPVTIPQPDLQLARV